MPPVNRLERSQVIDTDLDTAWQFISSPLNLEKLTPPEMGFEILTELPASMYDGLLIEYRVKIPLLGSRCWLSEIQGIREKKSFIDVQLVGPYRLWHHYHEVTQQRQGIAFRDVVTYVMPYGPFGSLAHHLFVREELETIFNFRDQALKRCLEG